MIVAFEDDPLSGPYLIAGVAMFAIVVIAGLVFAWRDRRDRRNGLTGQAPAAGPLPPIDTRPLKRLVNASWQAGAYDGGLTAMVEAVRVEATGEDR